MPFDPNDAEAKAAIKAAVEEATKSLADSVEKLEAKRDEALAEAKEAKRQLRASQEIKPEDLAAAEERADKAEKALSDATKQIKILTSERDKAVKDLESESGAARTYALDAELAGAIAEGNVLPSLVPAFKALMSGQAKADLVDGKYAVTIGDKAAREHIKTFLESEEGKAFRAAPLNGGGGAPGGSGAQGAKTITRAAWDGMDHAERAAFFKDGGKVVDAAA